MEDDIIYGYKDGNFPIKVGKLVITDTSIDGEEYKKRIMFMRNTVTINPELIAIMLDERKYTNSLIHYIANTMTYGTNYIELVPKVVQANEGTDLGDISKAIKRLKELDVIVQANTIEKYKNVNKYFYIVNHNYIFKGNIKDLVKSLKG